MNAKILSRHVQDDGWRRTTYSRPDGSTFEVAVPALVDHSPDSDYSWTWNDDHEAQMVARLAGGAS